MRKISLRMKTFLSILTAVICLCSPAPSKGEDVLNADCTINEAVFERDWRKYSDIDERIKLTSRSLEAQKVAEITQKIEELEKESLRLQAEIVFNGQLRREVRELKKALVTTLRANLIKSVFRLSFLTADAVKTGFDAGSTFAELFTFKALKTLPDALEKIGQAASVVSGIFPKDAEIAESVGENAEDMKMVLDTFTSSTDDIAINLLGKTLSIAEDKAKELFPSWDTVQLSPEDISILESQYLNNQALDKFLDESYAKDRLKSVRVKTEIPAEIELLQEELNAWEGKEKQRVREMLIAGCLESKKKAAGEGHWERTSVEVRCLCQYNNENSVYTLSSGSGTRTMIGSIGIPEKDRGFFKMSYSWNEPEASYEAGRNISLKISAQIDEWRNRSGNPGGWIIASIGAHALRDDSGNHVIEVSCKDGKIMKGSDTKTVWIKLYGGREGDYFVLDITTPSGHVLYRYDWTD